MKASKFSENQIVAILKSHQTGKTVEDICREQGIASAIFYTWKKEYAGMESTEIARMHALEKAICSEFADRRVGRVLWQCRESNQGWSMDFLSDIVIEDKNARMLNIMDKYSRKCLLLVAQKTYSSKDLVTSLKLLMDTYGKPSYLRCNNGHEFISGSLEKFCKKNEIELCSIQPGEPTQNGLVERLNGTVRRECLNLKTFKTIADLQEDLDKKWWNSYSFDRPHTALKGKTPQMVYQNQE